MFCHIKKIRNMLLLLVVISVSAFLVWNKSNKVHKLMNEELSISSDLKGPAVILFTKFPKNNDEYAKYWYNIAMFGQSYIMFKNSAVRTAIILYPEIDADDMALNSWFSKVKLQNKFEMDFFTDRNKNFAKSWGVKDMPVVLIIKDGKIIDRITDDKYQWNTIDGAKAVLDKLEVSMIL